MSWEKNEIGHMLCLSPRSPWHSQYKERGLTTFVKTPFERCDRFLWLVLSVVSGFVLVFYYMDWWKHLNKCHYFLVWHSSHWPEFFISKHIWDVKNLHHIWSTSQKHTICHCLGSWHHIRGKGCLKKTTALLWNDLKNDHCSLNLALAPLPDVVAGRSVVNKVGGA